MNKKLIRIPVQKNETKIQTATRVVLDYNHEQKIKWNKFTKIVNHYMDHEGYKDKLNDLLLFFYGEIQKGVDPYVKYKVAVSNN